MAKARQTREKIIQQAAPLFNQRGFAGSSLADLMRLTGLTKGGIYNHFDSKDEIALEAFDYLVGIVRQRYRSVLRQHRGAVQRLEAMLDLYRSFLSDASLQGGCPLLNTAVDSDDAHPVLKRRAQQAMDEWRVFIVKVLEKGVQRQEVRAEIDADAIATLIIATLEGAIMMSKLYNDPIHLYRGVNHLQAVLASYRL